MTIGIILLIAAILILVGAFPVWPYSRNWGYYPSSGLGVAVVVLLVLVFWVRI
jgi:Kef-type K+ transport system membrane component KefB